MAGAMAAISNVNAANGRGGFGGRGTEFELMPVLIIFLIALLIYAATRILISAVKEGEVIRIVVSALLVVLLVAVTFQVIPATPEEENPSGELIDQWIGWAYILDANGRNEINVTNSDGVIDVDAWLEEYREK